MKKILFLLKLFLLIVILIWIFRSVNTKDTLQVLSKTNLIYFFLAILFNNLSNFFLTVKWHRLAKPLKLKSGFIELLKLNYISVFYSSFVPGQASGELIKGIKLAKKENSIQKVWIPILIDKVTNLLIVFFIGLLAILLDEKFRQNLGLIALITCITSMLIFLTLILFSENTENLTKAIKDLIVKILNTLKINTENIKSFSLTYFEEYKKNELLLFETLGWSFLTKLPHIIAFYLLAVSLNINLNIFQSAWLFSTVSIVTLLPISFSGLGVREGTLIVILPQAGVDPSSALSLSLLIFVLGISIALIGGVLELFSGVKNGKPKRR